MEGKTNIHGGQQTYAASYFDTYSSVVNWFSIYLLSLLTILQKWASKQIDFVMAYTQAPPELDMYMRLPQGIEYTISGEEYVLKLLANLYGSKQGGKVWADYLKKGLKEINFVPSRFDKCVYYHGSVILCFYVDNGIFVGPDNDQINQAVKDLKGPKFDIEE
eukprot:12769348-Ditylum_brightwellii.AAC.1